MRALGARSPYHRNQLPRHPLYPDRFAKIPGVTPVATTRGGTEVMFAAADDEEVRTTYTKWSKLGLQTAQEVTKMPFGLIFVATDPDGHRLRVC